MSCEYKLFIDGASRGNPGPAAIGIVVMQGEEILLERGYAIGVATNNVAEYMALLVALKLLRKEYKACLNNLHVISDSLLLIKQMRGEYQVRHPNLLPLKQEIEQLLKHFAKIRFQHVLRHLNTLADAQANKGLDLQKELPAYLAFNKVEL